MTGEKNRLQTWASASTHTDPAPALPTGSDPSDPPCRRRSGSYRRSLAGPQASFSTDGTAAHAATPAAAAPTPSAPKHRRLPRPDSGFFDADMAMPSVRTFQVRYLRGFQLAAPTVLVNTDSITPAELSNLARAAVAAVSDAPISPSEAGHAVAEAPGNPAQCVFTLGQISVTDQAAGLQHFDLRVTDVLSLKVVGKSAKRDRPCSVVLVTRGTGVSPADMVRCHWIEFDNWHELKGFTMCMNDAFTAAHESRAATIQEGTALESAARALSFCSLLADTAC